ncbi:hypothetical protein [Viridibacterium curvum]|uniref:Tox-MPTase3 domain-containing protein n=1 Tax=Viridibacterium curvum TaxID=1101404 RepID=A0ABP9QS82_9RHOO
MRMKNTDMTLYPNFTRCVKNDLPKYAADTEIALAMREIGGLDNAALVRALSWNDGPDIAVVANLGAYGEFTSGAQSNEIRISQKLVQDYESGMDLRNSFRKGSVHFAVVTLLHELVHWGDDKMGIDRPGEEGEEFERRIYGNVVGELG